MPTGEERRGAVCGKIACTVCARHDQQLGGASPLWRLMAPTTSQGQLRRREAGWEGSPRRNPAPRNTNRVEGWAIWVSLLKKAKPVTINRVVT